MDEDRQEFIRGLRDMITLFSDERVPLPNMFSEYDWGTLAWHSMTKEELAELARAAAQNGLKVKKDYNRDSFRLTVGSGRARLYSSVHRGVVCRAVDTGKTEPYQTYADDAPMVTKERPIYEWVCDEPLLASED